MIKNIVNFFVLFAIICSCFDYGYATEAKVESVLVTGMGISEQSAIKNASKAAIQQVVGMYVVSDAVMENSELIKDQVLSQSNAYIKSFEVLKKSKDEDGLFEVEAKVEVEVGKLTNKLGELNVAMKHVGTDEFFAVAIDKFESTDDFRTMAERVIYQPLKENKQIYTIDIKKFAPVAEYDINRMNWIKSSGYNVEKKKALAGELLPFKLDFYISLNQDYLDSILQFFENSAKQTFSYKKTGDFFLQIIETPQFTKNFDSNIDRIARESKTLKAFEFSQFNYNILQTLHTNFIVGSNSCNRSKGKYTPYMVISLLNAQNTVIKKAVFSNGSHEGLSPSSSYSSGSAPNTDINISDILSMKSMRSLQSIAMPVITGHVSAYVMKSNRYNIYLIKNTNPMSCIMLLERGDAANIKGVKIEVLWDACS